MPVPDASTFVPDTLSESLDHVPESSFFFFPKVWQAENEKLKLSRRIPWIKGRADIVLSA
jgi:hypothetical protein